MESWTFSKTMITVSTPILDISNLRKLAIKLSFASGKISKWLGKDSRRLDTSKPFRRTCMIWLTVAYRSSRTQGRLMRSLTINGQGQMRSHVKLRYMGGLVNLNLWKLYLTLVCILAPRRMMRSWSSSKSQMTLHRRGHSWKKSRITRFKRETFISQ